METNLSAPGWLVFLAAILAPKSHREYIQGDLLDLCKSTPEYRQRVARCVAGAAAQRTRDTFHIGLLAGELVALSLPVWSTPRLPVVIYVAAVAAFLQAYDIYTEETEGTPLGMTIDWVVIAVFTAFLEFGLASYAPALALPTMRIFRGAVLGGVLAAGWRLVFRQMEPSDPRFKKLKESNVATWHVNVLFMAASVPIMVTNAIAVPDPGHVRDLIGGALPIILLGASYRIQTGAGVLWGPQVERYDWDDLENRTLKKWLRRVWAPEPDQKSTSRLPGHLIAEILYFAVLLSLLALACWRWISGDPLSAQTDWLQVELSFAAIAAMAVLWIRIKRLNLELQKALALELQRRKQRKQNELDLA